MRTFAFRCHIWLVTLVLVSITPSTSAYERVVSTDAAMTELMLAFGLADSLIGVDVSSQLPPAHASVANIGYHRQLSAEGLISLNPDLVIASQHMGPPSVVRALQTSRAKLVQFENAYTIKQLRLNIEKLATLFNAVDTANDLLQRFDQRVRTLQQQDHRHLNGAFLLKMQHGWRLAGRGTSGDAFIQLLGLNNIAQISNYQALNMESLLRENPDVILLAAPQSDDEIAASIKAEPVFALTSAAKSDRMYLLPSSGLVTGLSLSALTQAAQIAERINATESSDS